MVYLNDNMEVIHISEVPGESVELAPPKFDLEWASCITLVIALADGLVVQFLPYNVRWCFFIFSVIFRICSILKK